MTGPADRVVIGHVVVAVQGDVAAAMEAAGIRAVAITRLDDPYLDEIVAMFEATIWLPPDTALLNLAEEIAATLHERGLTPRCTRPAEFEGDVLALLATPEGVARVRAALDASVRWMPAAVEPLGSTPELAADMGCPGEPSDSALLASQSASLRDRMLDPRFCRSPFPTSLLPPLLRTLVSQGARAIGCGQTMLALPLLGVLAGCIGNRAVLRIKAQWYVPAVLWIAIIEESGQLKTPALDSVSTPLRERETSIIKSYKARQEAHKNELELWKAMKPDERGDRPAEPRPPERLLISDTTTEAVAERLDASPLGMLVWCDELAAWFKSFDVYRGGQGPDAQRWLSAHDAKEWFIDRKGAEPIAIPKAAVSIVGGIQPDVLREVLTAEHFRNGLAARLLMAMPPRKQKHWSEAEIDEPVRAGYQALLGRLLAMRPQQDLTDGALVPRVLSLASDAKAEYVAWYERHAARQNDAEGAESSLLAKLEGGACRLALVLHLARVANGDATANPDVVDLQSVRLGITLAEWFAHEGLRVYAVLSESDEDRARRRLVEAIHQRLGGRASVRDTMRRGPRLLRGSADKAQRALDDLVEHGLAHWEHVQSGPVGGRPTEVVVLDVDLGDETEDLGDTTSVANLPVVSPPPGGRLSPSLPGEVLSPEEMSPCNEVQHAGFPSPAPDLTPTPWPLPQTDAPCPPVTQPEAARTSEPPSIIAERCLVESVHSGRESDVRACWNVLARHTSATYATEVELDARHDLARGADAA